MIANLAAQIRSQADEYARLQQLEAQADAVRATANILDDLVVQLQKWSVGFTAVASHLELETVAAIRADAARIGQLISAAREEFMLNNFQQANKLGQINSRVEKLRATTKNAWCAYADARVKPYARLAEIARRLPSMARQMDTIDGYLASATGLAKDLPTKPDAVKQFDGYIARLQTLMGDLEGLPSDVRAFLDKLMAGTATFADVTQTVFDWCRTEGLSDKLRIARL